MENNNDITWEETQDPQACQTGNPELLAETSRDPVRTPFQWNKEHMAGFSSAAKTWLPVHPNYLTLNLEAQKAAERSHFKLYQQLAGIRLEDTFQYGDFESKALGNVLAYTRTLEGEKQYGVAINFGTAEATINITSFENLPEDPIAVVVALTLESKKSIE